MTKTLKLKGAPIVNPKLLEERKSKGAEVLAQVKLAMEEFGVTPETMEPPPDPSGMNNFETFTLTGLAELHTRLVNFAAYLEKKHAEAQVIVDGQKRAVKAFFDETSLKLTADGTPKTEHGFRIRTTDVYKTLDADLFHVEAVWRLTKARLNGISSQASAISRLITARQAELEAGTRNGNLGKRRGPFGRGPTRA